MVAVITRLHQQGLGSGFRRSSAYNRGLIRGEHWPMLEHAGARSCPFQQLQQLPRDFG